MLKRVRSIPSDEEGGHRMTADLELYQEKLRAQVCLKCIDGDGRGNCLLAADATCPMMQHLSKIVDSVRSIYSTSMVPYETALREQVCGACIHQSADKRCRLRDDVECALDRYFPLIVQTIEGLDFQVELKNRQTGWR
jgi:hypothetical protein